MIYLISDIHGKLDFKGLNEYIEKAGDTDLLIVLGDVSLNFGNKEENKIFTWLIHVNT